MDMAEELDSGKESDTRESIDMPLLYLVPMNITTTICNITVYE